VFHPEGKELCLSTIAHFCQTILSRVRYVISTTVLRIQVFWDVTPRCWASASSHSFKVSGYVNTASYSKTLESCTRSFPRRQYSLYQGWWKQDECKQISVKDWGADTSRYSVCIYWKLVLTLI